MLKYPITFFRCCLRRILIEAISFRLNSSVTGVGLIGKNGAGKSTYEILSKDMP